MDSFVSTKKLPTVLVNSRLARPGLRRVSTLSDQSTRPSSFYIHEYLKVIGYNTRSNTELAELVANRRVLNQCGSLELPRSLCIDKLNQVLKPTYRKHGYKLES